MPNNGAENIDINRTWSEPFEKEPDDEGITRVDLLARAHTGDNVDKPRDDKIDCQNHDYTEAENLTQLRIHNLHRDKIVLAPMVRQNCLPFRLLCLRMGADLVYSEEIVDHRFKNGSRVENAILNTIDYLDERGKVFFRTCDEERGKLVVQLGSCDPERALEAVKLVAKDVVAVDFNFGCPKPFSIKGGMGAAMLDKPDEIRNLLTTCVQNTDVPITCKIRVLPDLDRTIQLVKLIESCGVVAIGVHGRCRNDRPHHSCKVDFLRTISENVSIPIIANGGSNSMKSHRDIIKFKDATKASSVMIARIAQKNPSIFRSDGHLEPIEVMITEYLKLAAKYANSISNSKYILQTLISSGGFGKEFVRRFHAARDLKHLYHVFGLDDWLLSEGYAHTMSNYDDETYN